MTKILPLIVNVCIVAYLIFLLSRSKRNRMERPDERAQAPKKL